MIGAGWVYPISDVLDMENSAQQLSSPEEGASGSSAKQTTPPVIRVEDRRVSTRMAEGRTETEESGRSSLPTFVEELLAQTKQAEKRLSEKIQWMEEEISRTRERLSREQERKLEAEKRKIIQSFLEIGDHLERALSATRSSSADVNSLRDGIQQIQAIFINKLQQAGAAPIQPQGQPFDPNCWEAVLLGPVDQPELDQTVLEVLETGYLMGDQVLRPAKVKVAAYSPS